MSAKYDEMNSWWVAGAVLLSCAATAFAAAKVVGNPADRVVSLRSLLDEMIDREAVAKWPSPAYWCKEASSHDRRKKNPADPEGWHSNHDYGQFIRIETNSGRQEWVIMEDAGPGTITRFWTPLNQDMDNATIRFYFDDASTPAITARFNDLFRGCDFVPPPFAFVSWNETDLRNQIRTPRKGRAALAAIFICRSRSPMAARSPWISYRSITSSTTAATNPARQLRRSRWPATRPRRLRWDG